MKKVSLIVLINIGLVLCASTKKKTTETIETTDPPGPAILAIEIVDRNDNSTDVRNNTKRTIESALGYGFQGNYYTTNQGKKYMVYPYSQRDIPPSQDKLDASNHLSQTLKIQKSVSYNLGSKVEPNVATGKQLFTPSASQAYVQPNSGYYPSTLFSTVGQSGQIGGLTTNFPAQAQTAASVPVIILRVYSNQLSDNAAIYPNLPQTHPYANNLNSVNLQSILANYLQQQYYQAQQAYKPVYQAPNAGYQVQDYAYQGQLGYQDQLGYQGQGLGYQGQNLLYQGQQLGYYQMQPNVGAYQQEQQQPQSQIDYKALDESAAQLPTHENYPDEAHTRVIYHGPKGHIQGVSYSASNKEYNAPAQSQSQTYTETQSYAPASDSQQIYTDSHAQSNSDKVYNYHAQSSNESNERTKKSSGSPVTFDSKEIEKKTKRNQ
ncbi:hypothetical protein CBL_01366 [Carabus blaptoides fortunei]